MFLKNLEKVKHFFGILVDIYDKAIFSKEKSSIWVEEKVRKKKSTLKNEL